jgi:mRNA interferase RelE/StbE
VTVSYRLIAKQSVEKDLRSIPRADLQRIERRIQLLSNEPRPPGCEKLSGVNAYRVRQGDYRILYRVDDQTRVVEIFKVGHRREIYR